MWRVGPKQGKVWAVGRANAQDPQGWKRPRGLWGWGLGSRNGRDPGVPPTPHFRGQGTSPGSPAGFLGLRGQGKRPPLLSCSSSLGSGWAPPACLSWSPQPPSYAPSTNVAGSGGKGQPWRAGDQPGSSAGMKSFLNVLKRQLKFSYGWYGCLFYWLNYVIFLYM